MTKEATSQLHFGLFCLLALVSVGFYTYNSWARDSAEQSALTSYLFLEDLPASAHVIECEELPNRCEPDNPTTICFVRIEPGDFDQLVRQPRFRKNEDACPENFSHTHQMGLTVGPSFKINEEHWGGTGGARTDLYPDAAHAQFIVLLSRPSKAPFHSLHCDSPASSTAFVRPDDGYLLTSGPTSRR